MTGATSLFFGGFYMTVVFLVMNLLSSFVLESVWNSKAYPSPYKL